MHYIFWLLIDAIMGIVHYFSDVQREKQGLPMRHNRYRGSCSQDNENDLDYLFLQQMQMEDSINSEAERIQQQREKYVFEDDDAEMDSVQANGLMPPKEDDDDDLMDSI